MAKLYANPSPEKNKSGKPKKETIAFLLNYSKALKITNIGKFQFDTIIN